MDKISAIIAVKDSPVHLFESLKSIEDFVGETIILDIGIPPDLKRKLSENKSFKIIEIAENIPFVELIREKSKNYAAYEYILFLDPDEIMPGGLMAEILKKLNDYDYFQIPRKNYIFGKWIKHSRWWPDYQIRLFKKDMVIWPTTIHQQPETKGRGFTIKAEEHLALLHHNYESIDEYLQKAIRYAKAEALGYLKKDTTFSIKNCIDKSISEFISRYFAEEGYKDGIHGLILSLMQMFYYFIVYAYFWEGKKYIDINDNDKLIHYSDDFFKQGLMETNHWMINKKLINPIDSFKKKITNKLL